MTCEPAGCSVSLFGGIDINQAFWQMECKDSVGRIHIDNKLLTCGNEPLVLLLILDDEKGVGC